MRGAGSIRADRMLSQYLFGGRAGWSLSSRRCRSYTGCHSDSLGAPPPAAQNTCSCRIQRWGRSERQGELRTTQTQSDRFITVSSNWKLQSDWRNSIAAELLLLVIYVFIFCSTVPVVLAAAFHRQLNLWPSLLLTDSTSDWWHFISFVTKSPSSCFILQNSAPNFRVAHIKFQLP